MRKTAAAIAAAGSRNQISGDYRGREAVFGLFGKAMEVTQGSFHFDLHAVLADDEHGVALLAISASRGGRSAKVNAVDVMHLRDGKVVEIWTVPADQYAFDTPSTKLSADRAATSPRAPRSPRSPRSPRPV